MKAAHDAPATSWDDLAERLAQTVQQLDERGSVAIFEPRPDSLTVSLMPNGEGDTQAFVIGVLAARDVEWCRSRGFMQAEDVDRPTMTATLAWPASSDETRAFVDTALQVLRRAGAEVPADLVYQTFRYGLAVPNHHGHMEHVASAVRNPPVRPFGLVEKPIRRDSGPARAN